MSQSLQSPARPAGRSLDILDSFTQHVAEHGYAGANFSQIAAELGISKGTIVHHYGTKDRLFAAMHHRYMRRRIDEAVQIVAGFPTPAEQLAGLIYSFLLYQVVDRNATVAFQREAATLASHPSLETGRELRVEYLEIVRSVLSDGVADGSFRALDVPVQSLLILGCSQWAWTWFRPDGDLPATVVGGDMVQLVLGGLLADRTALPALADPDGPVPTAVAALLHEYTRDLGDTGSVD